MKVAGKVIPLIEHLKVHLFAYPLLHMDESRVQVLKEPDKPATSQSYMWVQRGGPPNRPGVLFNYEPSRSTATVERLLATYQGALMTDGYTSYRRLAVAQGLTHLFCWAHARRKFKEAQQAQPRGKTGKADVAINFIAKLYGVEKRERSSDAALRHRTRQSQSLAILKAFHAWLKDAQQRVPSKAVLGKAVNYTLEYWLS